MKLTVKGLLFLIALASTLALAQTPPIQHVIVVIQENRSRTTCSGATPSQALTSCLTRTSPPTDYVSP